MKPSDFSGNGGADERFTAWLDGELTERERAEFEADLDRACGEGLPGRNREQAEASRVEALKLGDLLRRHALGSVRGCEGLNGAVLGRIQSEREASGPSLPLAEGAPVAAETEAAAEPLRRVVWGGLGGLAAAAVLFFALVQPVLHLSGPPPEYYAQLYKATSSDPAISAVAVHSEQDQVTVLWIDGLDYVPAQKTNN